jgi:hypothetical protein
MATWYELQRKDREAARRLRERGIPDEKPLFCGSGRGRAFGRRPVVILTGSQADPKVESPDREEKRD